MSQAIQRKPRVDAAGEAAPDRPPATDTGVDQRTRKAAAVRGSPFSARLVLLLSALLIALSAAYYVYARYGTTSKPPVDRILTPDELSQHNGENGSPLYLALLGEVYDVSKGRKHYGKNGGYRFFVGRDASKAFITGEFKDDLNDDVSAFTPEQCKSLLGWLEFYKKTYMHVGRVSGRLYDSAGQPTDLMRQVHERAAVAQSEEEARAAEEKQYPACSVRWTQAEGGSVWCEDGRHPRRVLSQASGDGQPAARCLCFEELGWSDARQVYPGCKPDASACST